MAINCLQTSLSWPSLYHFNSTVRADNSLRTTADITSRHVLFLPACWQFQLDDTIIETYCLDLDLDISLCTLNWMQCTVCHLRHGVNTVCACPHGSWCHQESAVQSSTVQNVQELFQACNNVSATGRLLVKINGGLSDGTFSRILCVLECGGKHLLHAGFRCGCRAFTCLSLLLYRADAPGVHVCALLPPSHEVSQVCQISPAGKASSSGCCATCLDCTLVIVLGGAKSHICMRC